MSRINPNYELARNLSSLAEAKQIINDNPYEAAAYSRAIKWVLGQSKLSLANIEQRLPVNKQKTKDEPARPGDSIRAKIIEFLSTGKIEELETLRADSRIQSALRFRGILGVGPAVLKAWLDAGFETPSQVYATYQAGNIQLTKLQIAGLKYRDDLADRIPRIEVEAIAGQVAHAAKIIHATLIIKTPPRIIVAGSYRRGAPTSGDVDIILELPQYLRSGHKDYLTSIVDELNPVEILSTGPTKCMLLVHSGSRGKVRQLDILLSSSDELPTMLSYFTGPASHNEMLRGLAKSKGFHLNQYGLYRGTKKIRVLSEADIYDALGIPYVAPKNRI